AIAKGGLITGTGAGTLGITTVGTDGYILKADSGAAGGVSWMETLPVADGGTGLTSLAQGYIPFGQGTSAFGSSANLFWDSTNNRLG
ncbi:hypothetical protein COX22_00380, partial [Candidatus Falkowbacteria bacterium CG23_combo_of_CG06-09_8_20_14_all_49_15]